MELAIIFLSMGIVLISYRVYKEVRQAGNLLIIVTVKKIFKQQKPLWRKIISLFLVIDEISVFYLIGLMFTLIGVYVLYTEIVK